MATINQDAIYETQLGAMYCGEFESLIKLPQFDEIRGNVNLIFTSPPFALNNKKRYDNRQGSAYKEWLAGYAQLFIDLLAEDGSLVIELGNAWEPGLPVMSTLALEALLELKSAGEFYLCQQFIAHNPARLPSPAQWVTVQRSRVTDSFTHIWWLSKTPYPKADNSAVLQPYSKSMKRLLERGKYNHGQRPSEHVIGSKSFLKDHGGSIPRNVLKIEQEDVLGSILDDSEAELDGIVSVLRSANNVFEFANTSSNDPYLRFCREKNIPLHPARMNIGLPTFFIKFLTEAGDLVVDSFAGSNTTGAAAEDLGRRWRSFEPVQDYVNGSFGRFPDLVN